MTIAAELTGRLTTLAAQTPDWQAQAACRGHDEPETWFPVGSGPEALRMEAAAIQVCMGCPVRAVCLEWALETGQDSGVWGGMSEYDRGDLTGRYQQYRTSPDQRPAWQVIVETRLSEFRALEGEGLSGWEIAQRMRTNAQTISRVREALDQEQGAEVKAA